MGGVPNTSGLIAKGILWCLLFFLGYMEVKATEYIAPSLECRMSFNLTELENKTVYEYHSYTNSSKPGTILALLSKRANSSSKEEIASMYNISTGCLAYLEFTLPEVALFLLNTSQFKDITFEDVVQGVFVFEVETVLRRIFTWQKAFNTLGVKGNETLEELASIREVSLDTTPILKLFLLFVNNDNVEYLSGFLQISLSAFEFLNRTAEELGTILAVPDADEVRHYSFLRLIKIAVLGQDYVSGLQMRIHMVRHSLDVWVSKIKDDLDNMTAVLDLVRSKIPMNLHYLTAFLIDVTPRDLDLLKITLQEFAELLNKTVMKFYDYKLYPQLVTFIVKTRKNVFELNREAMEEAKREVRKILMSYNVTAEVLIEFFNLTEIIFHDLSPLRIEVLCARYTLLRYANNLNMTLAEVADKLNKTEAELSYNLTVQEFHVVIRKLLIIRTFEAMSQMLGVSQHFLVNSLDIQVPISYLSMCQLDSFLTKTRQSVLDLNEVLSNKTLAFVCQINAVHVTTVYKFTIERFIIEILHLDIRYFFALNGLTYSSDNLEIVRKYHFFELEHLFQLRGDDPMYSFVIFRHSLVWIIKHIIYLKKTDINECRQNSDRCPSHSLCVNLPGTYECHCPKNGYRGRYCADIDECKEGCFTCPDNAECKNLLGSYECRCAKGFRHNADNNTCDDFDECEKFYDNSCFYNAECINTPGSYYCRCPDGYKYDDRKKRCKDINECEEDRHVCHRIDKNAECENKYPGFECNCRPGFEAVYNNSVNPKVLFNCTDIDECTRGNAICPLNSECINTIGGANCRCFPGFEKRNGRCRAKRFIIVILIWVQPIRYRRVPTHIEVASGFPFFGELYKNIYIYHNGLISIGKRYYRSEPKRLTSLKKNVIAVFWANTDIVTLTTSITYQVVDRSTSEFREQLDNTSALLKNCSGLTEFNATWMLVVTWERVSPFARFGFFSYRFNPYTNEESSYQAVLITNGTSSYVIYSYEDGGMNWNRRLRRKCAVGYATKDKKYSFEDEDSFGENIFQIDSKEFDVDGIKTRGTFCKSLNAPDEPIELTNEQKCMNWYNEEPDPEDWLEELTDCPATFRSARQDNRYRRMSSSAGSRGARIDCYELRFPTTEFGASHQCCYLARGERGRRSGRGAFVSKPPQAGRAYRYHFRNRAMRQKGDIEPFEVCCGEGESLCNLFYEKRPLTTAASAPEFPQRCSCSRLAGGCRRRPCRPLRPRIPWLRIIIVSFWGDPHLLTLDGFQYTFNGLGDYVLVRTRDRSLHLHARTKRPTTTKGGLSNATVISALAFKTKDSDKGQIVFDDSVPGNLSFTITGMDGSCENFTIADFDEGKDFTGMSIERSTINNKTAIISFPSGLSIEVSPGLELLQLSVKAPSDMMNKTEGLLGNFNGDKTDELIYPNGTMIPSNSTEQEIFSLGQQWVVPHDERLFVSSNCTLQNVSFDDMFVPAFLNLSAVTDEIKAICGDNRECIFDVMQTGNKELGQETKGFEEEAEAAKAELENTPPNITGPVEISVTVNQMTKFNLSVFDTDNDDVTLEVEELPEGASFTFNASENVGHFVWTPVNASNITLEFVATDSKNDTSVHPVVINMCRCENNGTCDFTEFVGDDTGAFRIVGCNCSDEFEGDFCEMEVLDACADDPCADNVTCNTTRNPFGFKCGPCPPGLTGDGEDCFEFDECANESLSQCNQTCVNTFGSFRCECKQGYTSREEGRICEDINECQDAGNLNNCSENALCTNLPGAYNCTCHPGFEGDPMKNCTDIDECTNGVAQCSHICHNKPGSFECSCLDGFKLAADNQTCDDINECEGSHNCEHMCDNRIGSYICKCPPGFELNADNVTCKVAEASTCDATNGGCSDTCVNRTGEITCFCNAGYNLTADGKTCEDINECMMGNHGCSVKCLNTNGSFTCGCYPGYALAGDMKSCRDVNECDTPSLNNCGQVCENSNGSFTCSCDDGFTLESDNKTCSDVNECTASSTPCNAGVCTNQPGTFQCVCLPPTFYSDGECKDVRVFVFVVTLIRVNTKTVVWQEDLGNPETVAFGVLARRVELQIDDYYRRKSRFTKKFVKAKVKRFRKGSVLADVDLTFADDATDVTPDALKSDLPTSGEMGNMSYNPSNAAVGDFNECDDKATHNCHIHATCINKPGSFECRCKEKYSGDGVKNCEYSPEPADDPDDNKNKKLGIIFGAFFGVVVLLLVVGLFFHLRYKRYEADLEDKNNTSFTTRSVNSGVTFPENSKEDSKRTGSYELQSRQMYASLSPQSRTSGDYDYPDPQPTGTRESFPYYDNPGLQRDHAQ